MRKQVQCPFQDITPFPFFAPPIRPELPSIACKDAHCVYCTGTAWIDRLNDNLLSALQLANLPIYVAQN